MHDYTRDKLKNYTVFQKIIDVFMVVSVICVKVMKLGENFPMPSFIAVLSLTAGYAVFESVLVALHFFGKASLFDKTKLVHLICLCTSLAIVPYDSMLVALFMIEIMIVSLEYIFVDSALDKSTIVVREFIAIIPVVIAAVFSWNNMPEKAYFCFILILVVLAVSVLMIEKWIVMVTDGYEHTLSELKMENDKIISDNIKMEEYQEKVRLVNEQINYQKIEINKALNDLEQVNIESLSHIDIMKYMGSTFDIGKCISIILDKVMEIKQPKLCAVFVEKGEYKNKYDTIDVRTGYTLMEHRVRRDFEAIYKDFKSRYHESKVFTGSALKIFPFIGDADVHSVALVPIMDADRQYGLMLIASNDKDYFESGLQYFEATMVEFDVSVKNTKLYIQMEDMARRDGLTGIYNRLYFNQLITETISDVIDKHMPLSVALFDIDKFKRVNDTYGHLAGDEVIKMVAKMAEKYAEEHGGFAARYGGEEFLVILPDYDETAALPILEKMHEEIKSTVVKTEGHEIRINCCIGLTSYPNLCSNTSLLVSRADRAMYYGKKHGRGRLTVDSPELDHMMDEKS